MLDKIKNSLSLNKDDPAPKLLPQIISIFQSQDIKSSKQTIQNLKQTLNFLSQIASTNKQAIKSYISTQIKAKQQSQDADEQNYTFEQDLAQIQTNMADVINNFKILQETENKINSRIQKLIGNKIDDAKVKQMDIKIKTFQEQIRKRDEQIRAVKQQLRINKQNQNVQAELLMNSKMQTSLLSNQVKDLQQKVRKYQKQTAQKDHQLINLQQQKKHLLSMNSSNPQIDALKNQLLQAQKRYNIQKSKVQQKQKQIQQSKKKIEEQKNNLISMADDLKNSQFKQQQITKKYQNSKTQIRKYRQIKLQEIKKLNQEILQYKNKQQRFDTELNQLKAIIKSKDSDIQKAKQGYQTVISNTIKQNNLQQLIQVLDQNLKEQKTSNEQNKILIETLKEQLDQLKEKRQSLLKILQHPVKHQIHNLQKIHKHMEILYKDYLGQVFEKGNIVGFERKIKDLMANVSELRQDLLM